MIDFFRLDRDKNLNYIKSLEIVSSLSKLFSDNATPFLHYRVMENIFCDCFKAKNLSRSDTAYDAQIKNLGIGLKTFICEKDSSIQKIAEFNKDSSFLKKSKNEKDLAQTLAKLRNERIALANDLYGIKKALYHCIARKHNKLIFFQTDYEKINVENIKKIKNTKSSLSFDDGINEYFFNHSKSVLQRKFYIPKQHSSIDIKIIENPLKLLLSLQDFMSQRAVKPKIAGVDYVILPLYSTKSDKKSVPEKSGLNQWNAGGRARKYGEVYIPVPMIIHKLYPHFFPPRDVNFTLKTPLNESLCAKLCQDNAKALMSNPNTALAKWILQRALRLGENELATYEKMQNLGFDSVIINKEKDLLYSIDIMPLDSYEKFSQNSF